MCYERGKNYLYCLIRGANFIKMSVVFWSEMFNTVPLSKAEVKDMSQMSDVSGTCTVTHKS